MALRLEELAKTIDHTLLSPTATLQDVDRLCEEAREGHFAAVCVLPYAVRRAVEALRGCDVKVATVVGFPLGADSTRSKIASAEAALCSGADELGIALNVSALLSGETGYVQAELSSIMRSVRVRSVNSGRGMALVKVIVDCQLLDDARKRLVCRIVEDAGADFVEAATTLDAQATLPFRDVELLRDWLPESVGVKATGAIETAAQAEEMVAAGAGRIGTPYAVEVIRGFARLRRAS